MSAPKIFYLMTMKASEILISKLKEIEGFSLKAYKCPAGVWTIGYGTTKGVYSGMVITYAEAEKLLKKDLSIFEFYVNKLGIAKTQGQFDALVDFTYNLGTIALGSSTLLVKIKAGVNSAFLQKDFEAIPISYFGKVRPVCSREGMYKHIIQYQFSRWNKSKGKVLPGLVKRREWEGKRFFE